MVTARLFAQILANILTDASTRPVHRMVAEFDRLPLVAERGTDLADVKHTSDGRQKHRIGEASSWADTAVNTKRLGCVQDCYPSASSVSSPPPSTILV
ncbi:hypothetical protein C8Q73DRAFT_144026 [Cubamyces lactineus]|nr:hypothetical protein C8Q73DRAFT_144026 [Cubamyces lactineus]